MMRTFEVTARASYQVTDDELRSSYGVDPLEPNRGQLAADLDAENYIEDGLGALEGDLDYVEVVVVEDGTIIGRARRDA
jgi:hypothetical protein